MKAQYLREQAVQLLEGMCLAAQERAFNAPENSSEDTASNG